MKITPGLLVLMVMSGIVSLVLAAEPLATPSADAKLKACFACDGKGIAKCDKAGCKEGKARCPAPCLKPDDGTWVAMKVEGHPPTDRWKQFVRPNGTSMAWNQGHAGELVVFQNGDFVNTGTCKTCGGSMRIECPNCKGTGQAKCSVCNGKKEIPESWSTFDHPRMKNRPAIFKLKDGRAIVGRRAPVVMGATTTLITATGEVKFVTSDLLYEQKQPTKP